MEGDSSHLPRPDLVQPGPLTSRPVPRVSCRGKESMGRVKGLVVCQLTLSPEEKAFPGTEWLSVP